MSSLSCEELCISRICNMTNQKYCIGLSQQEGLFFNGLLVLLNVNMAHSNDMITI